MEPTSNQILINVLIQVVNLVIFFLLFRYLIGNKITQAIQDRRAMMKKLKNADSEYQHIIADANKESHKIVAEAGEHKRRLIEEAAQLADKKGTDIVASAEKKAQDIISQADMDTKKRSSELEESFTRGVKQTTEIVVEKLFSHKKELSGEYIDTLIHDITGK